MRRSEDLSISGFAGPWAELLPHDVLNSLARNSFGTAAIQVLENVNATRSERSPNPQYVLQYVPVVHHVTCCAVCFLQAAKRSSHNSNNKNATSTAPSPPIIHNKTHAPTHQLTRHPLLSIDPSQRFYILQHGDRLFKNAAFPRSLPKPGASSP